MKRKFTKKLFVKSVSKQVSTLANFIIIIMMTIGLFINTDDNHHHVNTSNSYTFNKYVILENSYNNISSRVLLLTMLKRWFRVVQIKTS